VVLDCQSFAILDDNNLHTRRWFRCGSAGLSVGAPPVTDFQFFIGKIFDFQVRSLLAQGLALSMQQIKLKRNTYSVLS